MIKIKDRSMDLNLVFEGSSMEADLVNNILQDSGVETLVKNKNMGRLFPHYASTGGVQPVKIFVRNADYQKAQDIIKAFVKTDKP